MVYDGPGLASVLAVWALWIAIAAATWATNARTPLRLLYAVHAAGIRAGAGRVLVLLGWPVALAAVAVLVVALERFLAHDPTRRERRVFIAAAVLSLGLCATIGLPGAANAKHVDARLINIPAAIGVAIAFALSLWTLAQTGRGPASPRTRSDRYWLLLFTVLFVASLPWLLANLGFYAGDLPGLSHIFMSKQVRPEAGYPHLRAVHLGNHDGFDGLLLALCAVILMRMLEQMRQFRTVLGAYLSILFVYGLAVATADWWGEQIVKRGWASQKIASPARPSLTMSWLGILAAAALVWLLKTRVLRRTRDKTTA